MINWISVGDKLPPYGVFILLLFTKSKAGPFITQGYLTKESGFYGDGSKWEKEIYYDYYARQIQCIKGQTSLNLVTHWSELPGIPKKTKTGHS